MIKVYNLLLLYFYITVLIFDPDPDPWLLELYDQGVQSPSTPLLQSLIFDPKLILDSWQTWYLSQASQAALV